MRTSFFKAGQSMYLLGMAELAVYGFFKGDIALSRPPVNEVVTALNPALAYATAALMLIAVVLSFLQPFKTPALLVLSNLVFWLTTTRHLVAGWQDHINGFKTLWLAAGALLILVAMPQHQRYRRWILYLVVGILFVFFVDCGIAHFQFPEFVAGLIPTFIPFPLVLAYFAGVCLIAGGVGLLIPATRRLAATLSGVQIAGWFLLLHIPRALTLAGDEWIGVGESLAVAGICFMLAAFPARYQPV